MCHSHSSLRWGFCPQEEPVSSNNVQNEAATTFLSTITSFCIWASEITPTASSLVLFEDKNNQFRFV